MIRVSERLAQRHFVTLIKRLRVSRAFSGQVLDDLKLFDSESLMRITNDDYTPIEILSELAARDTSKCPSPRNFFEDEQAKHDWLVEAWADKLDEILNSFKRYGTLVAETQSIRDQGIDVYLEFEVEGRTRRVGFQLKSAMEVDRADKSKDSKHSLVGVLKRQAFEAANSRKVDEWWIVPCIDHVKYAKLIQQINSEIVAGNTHQNGMQIKLLEPRAAVSFLSKNKGDIDAFCTRLLCRDDEILKASRSEIFKLNDFQRRCVLELIWPALDGENYISIRDFFDFSEDEDDLGSNSEELQNLGFLESEHGEGYKVNPYSFPALCALYFEGRVRHEMSTTGAAAFALAMVDESD